MKATLKIVAAAAAATLALPTAAMADKPEVSGKAVNSANVANGDCTGFVPGPNGEITTPYLKSASKVQRVHNKNGAFSMCHFNVPAEQKPASMRVKEGFTCTVSGVPTNESIMQVSPGGRGMLLCRTN
ncbi:hypothetical protein [Croceicoccus gelatinilyticus]|uniref:hypothetical protein n=1 Tax=Croceicoccus gelatinilyticus TaxID=2835536 RepID=UPI001BCD7A78|nr:hypothetical protein [Croceicoccus gelatinilyticus]MBS7670802.1 hypothetical protein [Croceicoccus gelatinilyticus]